MAQPENLQQYADFILGSLSDYRGAPRSAGREWIDTNADFLRAACDYATQPSGPLLSTIAYTQKRELEKAGIRPDSDARSCNLAVEDLVNLWETLVGDTDAFEAARAYLDDWPPTADTLVSLAVDMALPSSAPPGEREHALLSGMMAPHATLVRVLGDAARTGQRVRAAAEAQRFSGACANDETQYLILRTGPNVEDMAVLVSIPRGDAARGAGTVIGRMYRDIGRYNLPSPAPDVLSPRIRPYVAFIPALVASALAGDGTPDVEPTSWDPDYWRYSPSGVVRSFMEPVASPIAVSPQFVIAHLRDGPESLRGARYAWLDERVLERLLAVGAGQHAASVAIQVPSVYDQRGASNNTSDNDQSNRPAIRYAKRRDTGTAPQTFQPSPLGARALNAIVRSGLRVHLESLPAEVADPLAYGIWRAECASTAVDESDRFVSLPTSDRLLDVSRYWGVNPTDDQARHPQLLCGVLARGAVTDNMVGGARLSQQRVARIGPPLLTAAERAAVNAVCAAPRDTRFVQEPDLDVLFDTVFAIDPWIAEATGEEPLVDAVIDRARHLISQANEIYNVKQDESPQALPLDAQGLSADTQALAAIAALRSGLEVTVDDLADAGSVCTLLAPLDALFP
nr:hypothetical protein [Pandoravirus massiliensis]